MYVFLVKIWLGFVDAWKRKARREFSVRAASSDAAEEGRNVIGFIAV